MSSVFSSGGRVPDVSVIIAAYNSERTIQTAISSVLQGQGGVLEVIVCDDASTDRTLDVLGAIEDPRVRVIRNDVNRGPGPCRDIAIRHARGEWLAFLDADDSWRPGRLDALLNADIQDQFDLVFDDSLICHDSSRGMIPWRALHGVSAFGGYGGGGWLVPIEDYVRSPRLLMHPVVRSSVVKSNGIVHGDRRFAEDAEFFLRIGLKGGRFFYVPRPLYMYRVSPGSLTAKASDPRLMRACLEECAAWKGWSIRVQRAFEEKSVELRKNELQYQLYGSLQKLHFLDAFRLLLGEPSLVPLLPARIMSRLRYLLHRRLSGGFKR